MTEPTQDDYTVQPEDDDPRSLTGEPADLPEDGETGGLYEDQEL